MNRGLGSRSYGWRWLLVLAAVSGCASVSSHLTLPPVVDITQNLETYPMVVGGNGAKVYLDHDSGSRVLRKLPKGSIVSSLAEAGSQGKVAYYNVRTLSGIEGWVKRWDVKPTTTHQAERTHLQDQQLFEQSLQDTILATVAAEIKSQGIHSFSKIESTWIIGEVESDSSASSVDVTVTTIMRGALLGQDKYQVDSRVNLFLHIDRDHLPASKYEVNRVVIVKDEQIQEMPLQKKIGLLNLIGPFFGIPPIP